MAPFKSLYDSLLEQGLAQPEEAPVSTSEPGGGSLETLSGRAFAEAVLRSEEFRLYIVEGLSERDLPPAVLCRLIDHGWGKPVDHLEVKDTTAKLEDLSVEDLEQRAMKLAELARLIRTSVDPAPAEVLH